MPAVRRGRGTDKPTVFISYRRDDSGDVTGRIRDRVAAAVGDDRVFMDIDSIPLGFDFRKHIAESVGRCDAVLAIVGPRWLDALTDDGTRRIDQQGDFVRLELEAALERDIPVIPVLVLGAQPLTPSDVPDSLRELAFRQATSVRRDPDFHPDMDRLLTGLLAPSTPPEPAPPTVRDEAERTDRAGSPPHPTPSFLTRGRVIAFVVALLVVVGAVGAVLASTGGSDNDAASSGVPAGASIPTTTTGESTAATDDSADIPLVIEQQGDTLVTRGYTMQLAKGWATSAPGDDFVRYLGHSTEIFLTGPSPAYGDSVDFLVRDEAASSTWRSHTEPTFREIDGVRVGQFQGTTDSTTQVVAIAVVGDTKYGFELDVFNSEKELLDTAVHDFEDMLDSIKWKRE